MSFDTQKKLLNTLSPSSGTRYSTYLKSIKDNGSVFNPNVKQQSPFKFLQYPIDAADQKHYILFDILRRKKGEARIKTGGNTRVVEKDTYLEKVYSGANRFYGDETIAASNKSGAEGREIAATIALYMPQNVKLGFTADYGAEDQGMFVGFGAKLKDAFSPDNVPSQAIKNLFAQAAKNISNVTSLVGFEGLGTAAVQRKLGFAAAPLQEMIFNQIDFRSFSFDFKFTPTSKEESNLLRTMLDTFKISMLPTKVGNSTTIAAYHVPDEFCIRFMHGQNINPYIDVVGLCACTGVDITYGGDKFSTHAAGDPVTITATLTFRELELMERKRYAELRGITLEDNLNLETKRESYRGNIGNDHP
jgi:hypothetical protein